jgi:hypothetical protein
MKLVRIVLSAACFALGALAAVQSPASGFSLAPTSRSALEGVAGDDKLVYADFEKVMDNRPVSARGGYIKLYKNEENPSNLCRFKGAAGGPDVPELVRLSKDSPNRALAFSYELRGPNQWASVGVEIHGQPDIDGKPVPDDLSGYKFLSMQLYATGVPGVTVEFNSRGAGVVLQNSVGPQMSFKVGSGMNTYRVPLNTIKQPQWVDNKTDPKDVLKKLTHVNVLVSCGPCSQPVNGTVAMDNLVFEK